MARSCSSWSSARARCGDRRHPDAADAHRRGAARGQGDPRALAAVGILVLSQHVNARYALELLSTGTDGVGYLLKERVSDLDELSTSVNRVGSGGSVLDPAVVGELVGRRRQADNPLEHLTEREREVLALMAEGRSNRAIAERLFVTDHTVEKHVKTSSARCACRRPPTITGACSPSSPTSTRSEPATQWPRVGC